MGSSKARAEPRLDGKRVLYVCEYGTLNGGERSLLAWLPAVLQAGCRVEVLAPSDGPFERALSNLGINVIPWLIDHVSSALKLEARRCRFAETVSRVRPQLIHANSLSMSRVVGPVAGRASIPSIGHLRDIVGISARAMSDLNENTLVLAVSEATANWHIRHGLSAERTQVLYNGVDMNEFTPRPRTHFLHRELGLANGAVLIGVIGQIVMRKGTDIALEAMKRLATQYATVHLVVAGERNSAKKEAVEFEDRLHAAASQSPLAGRVHFLGYRSDVPRILNELTLLIHAARQEPLGRVLLESAAVGVPVVATNVGGTGEIFPSKEAEIVLPDDAEAIAVAVAELLDDPALVKTRSATAHARIATKFDVRISVRNLLHHYRMLF